MVLAMQRAAQPAVPASEHGYQQADSTGYCLEAAFTATHAPTHPQAPSTLRAPERAVEASPRHTPSSRSVQRP